MNPKVPHNLKVARGTARKDRPADSPDPTAGRPVKPDWLGDVAAEKWDEVIALLESEGQLSPIYGDFIAEYCRAHQDAHDAERIIELEGEICESEKGGKYQHPAVGMKNKAIDRVMKFGKQLGISAATIKHVQKTKKPEKPSGKKRFFA